MRSIAGRVLSRRPLAALALLLALAACAPGAGAGGSGTPAAAPTAASSRLPRFSHVFIIVMENEDAGTILGNGQAPYVNALARQYATATRYYAVSHPSLPNYLALTSGSTQGYDGSDCGVGPACHVAGTQSNIADEIEASGRTWAAYLESMPQPCALGDSGDYAVRHNPFVYYDDIRQGAGDRCAAHDLPYDGAGFAQMLASGDVPDFVWISPNLCDDGHNDCGGGQVAQSDTWLAQNVPPILGSSAFQRGGVLFITWDESTGDGSGCCGLGSAGGRVATLVVSPLVGGGATSGTAYDHYSLLRTIEDSWGLGELNQTNPATQPGTRPMDDLFHSA